MRTLSPSYLLQKETIPLQAKKNERKLMGTIALQRKRKNIDLPVEALQKLSAMAASQGKTLKTFLENVLISKANTFRPDACNPSPSGDDFFADPRNLTEVKERAKKHNEGKAFVAVALHSAEDITGFLNSL